MGRTSTLPGQPEVGDQCQQHVQVITVPRVVGHEGKLSTLLMLLFLDGRN